MFGVVLTAGKILIEKLKVICNHSITWQKQCGKVSKFSHNYLHPNVTSCGKNEFANAIRLYL